MEKAEGAISDLRKECPSANNIVEPLVCDVTSDGSIVKAFEAVKSKPGRLDVLINNAGVTYDLEFVAGRKSLRDCFNMAYDVNMTGANVMTYTFMPLLLESTSPRLLFIAGLSQMTLAQDNYFPTPPQPAGWPKKIDFETIGYRCSKTALNMLMMDWNHKLKADGVKVHAVGPGILATNLGNMKDKIVEMGAKHPSIGGQLYKSVVEGERDDQVGKVIGKDGLIPL